MKLPSIGDAVDAFVKFFDGLLFNNWLFYILVVIIMFGLWALFR